VGKTPEPELGYKRPFLAFMLSLLPGVGYLYLGLMRRGLQTMVVFYGAFFIDRCALSSDRFTALVLPEPLFYTVFDSLQALMKINEGQQGEDKLLLK
jgi:hypothetical protein